MEDKLALITQNPQEVLNPETIEDVLRQDRSLCIYWGTIPVSYFPSSRFLPNLRNIQETDHHVSNLQAQQLQAGPHCGYFVPIVSPNE